MEDEIYIESESNKESTLPLKIQSLQIEFPSIKKSSFTQKTHKTITKLTNFFKSHRSSNWCRRISPLSPLTIFQQTFNKREEISLSISSPEESHHRQSFPVNFIKKMKFLSLINLFREWITHPMNLALLIWFICVATSSSMQALLLLGMLNKEFPEKSSQSRWIEINNQVLNALFTLMSLYQHPSLFHHLILLCRWRPKDIIELRKIYCKNGVHKPNEFAHMMFIVVLLQITCFSQYILCWLYWGYTIATRSNFFENFFSLIGFIAPTIAAAYSMYSPLGKEDIFVSENSETENLETIKQRASVTKAEWNGKILDFKADISVSLLSFFCTFCVFGWNMERLGFGNMYVHIAMFFLLCFAPLWIFGISALNISNVWVRNVVAISGMVLSVCGLMYGGFWRSKMREKFKLGSESWKDYLYWLFCCCCSLAQEVRTGNFYDVEDGKFYKRDFGEEDEFSFLLCPLPRESSSVKEIKMAPLRQLMEVM